MAVTKYIKAVTTIKRSKYDAYTTVYLGKKYHYNQMEDREN